MHGREVPTWNYIAVHAHGPLRLHDDPEWLLAHVTRLSDQSAAGRPDPWVVSDAPTDYVAQLLRGIVGFEMEVTRIEARWKMSQNRAPEEIDGVVTGLGASERPEDRPAIGWSCSIRTAATASAIAPDGAWIAWRSPTTDDFRVNGQSNSWTHLETS